MPGRRKRPLLVERLEFRWALNASDELVRTFAGLEAYATPSPEVVRQDRDGMRLPTNGATAAAVSVGAKHPLTDLPALSSLPSATATLYLDFNGNVDAQWGSDSFVTTPVFDQDGDLTTYTDAELAAIEGIWNYVAEDYAPFEINVSTVPPASFANGVGLRAAIGGDGSWLGHGYGGIAFVDTFTNSIVNTVYAFSENLGKGNAKSVAQAVSHEAGHGFGLDHQSSYNARGALIDEYSKGPGDGRAPIMGDSYDAVRGLWWSGPTPDSVHSHQDDIALIARPANGFGFRDDDHGNSANTATPLNISGTTATGTGLINSTSDIDYFSFDTDARTISFVVAGPSVYGNLDAKLELRDATGATVIASADPANSSNATVTAHVSAGSYRLAVASHGSYGDIGQYTISGTIQPIFGQPATLAAPTNLAVQAGSSSVIRLTWTDVADNEDGYRVERSANGGSTWIQIATLGPNATSYNAAGLAANAVYSFRVRAYNANLVSTFSNVATARTLAPPTKPTAPIQLQATSKQSNSVVLIWSDRSDNETGFKLERSTNRGRSWRQIAVLDADVHTYLDATVSPRKTYSYRVRAFNDIGNSSYSRTLVVATPAAPAAGTVAHGAAALAAVEISRRGAATPDTKTLLACVDSSAASATTAAPIPVKPSAVDLFFWLSARAYVRSVDQLFAGPSYQVYDPHAILGQRE